MSTTLKPILKHIEKTYGLKPSQVAKDLGISRQAYFGKYNQKSNPTFSFILKLADTYKIPASELFDLIVKIA
jgi:transcriptional regulator with XRE-family HTH domain